MIIEDKYALISVSNKDGIVDFAKRLVAMEWKIISSGGTGQILRGAGVPLQTVAELRKMVFLQNMGRHDYYYVIRANDRGDNSKVTLEEVFDNVFPTEMLGHRVATLHPEIHGGILAAPEMKSERLSLGYPPIPLVCVDFYDLQDAIDNGDNQLRDVLDKIDIGGPTALRGAAKNLGLPIFDFEDRERILQLLEAGEGVDHITRLELAAKVYRHTSRYDQAAAAYLEFAKTDLVIAARGEE